MRPAAAGLVAIFVAACAPTPRPSVLGEIEKVRGGAAAAQAKRLAPDAFAHAEKLRREADAAFEAEDLPGSQALGERSLAAYAHAHALARIAQAEEAEAAARKSLAAAQAELASMEADQARVAAELSALDMKIKVARDAQPITPSGRASPEREEARRAAARSLALQGRMLCAAARLLITPATTTPGGESAPAAPAAPAGATAPAGGAPKAGATAAGATATAAGATAAGAPKAGAAAAPAAGATAAGAPKAGATAAGAGGTLETQLAEATAAVDKLEGDLGQSGPAPIDRASRVRAGCLAVLTAARRASTPVSRAPGAGDALLATLSGAGSWAPARDERGVVVTLRGILDPSGLTPAGEARLRELATIAAAHPAFPVAVVLHSDREPAPRDEAAWRARADAIVRVLRAGQVQRVEPVLAGARAPVVDPAGRERGRNARVEIVFVTPESL